MTEQKRSHMSWPSAQRRKSRVKPRVESECGRRTAPAAIRSLAAIRGFMVVPSKKAGLGRLEAFARLSPVRPALSTLGFRLFPLAWVLHPELKIPCRHSVDDACACGRFIDARKRTTQKSLRASRLAHADRKRPLEQD